MGKATYHHGDLRRALIEAAVESAIADGPDQVSLRQVARMAGVSTAAPYRHFKDRDELMSAVAAEGYLRLLDAMQESATDAKGPLDQYRTYGLRYVTFAVSHPNLFRVMHVAKWCHRDASPEMNAAYNANEGAVNLLVERARARGELSSTSPAVQKLASQALVYGLARLYVDGHGSELGFDGLEVEEVVEAVLDVMGRGLAPR